MKMCVGTCSVMRLMECLENNELTRLPKKAACMKIENNNPLGKMRDGDLSITNETLHM